MQFAEPLAPLVEHHPLGRREALQPMILTFGHTKGGVGKSMLALNVAVERIRAGVDTLLID
ncbi:MAG: hypothetical protein ACK5AK_02355, partial [Gemmatimonas sp.]